MRPSACLVPNQQRRQQKPYVIKRCRRHILLSKRFLLLRLFSPALINGLLCTGAKIILRAGNMDGHVLDVFIELKLRQPKCATPSDNLRWYLGHGAGSSCRRVTETMRRGTQFTGAARLNLRCSKRSRCATFPKCASCMRPFNEWHLSQEQPRLLLRNLAQCTERQKML